MSNNDIEAANQIRLEQPTQLTNSKWIPMTTQECDMKNKPMRNELKQYVQEKGKIKMGIAHKKASHAVNCLHPKQRENQTIFTP